MKYEQSITLYKNILLPQTYRSLINIDNNPNMQPSSINLIYECSLYIRKKIFLIILLGNWTI